MDLKEHDAQNGPDVSAERQTPEQAEEKEILRVEVSSDFMTASLFGSAHSGIGVAELHELFRSQLQQNCIQHGLMLPAVKEALQKLAAGIPLDGFVIARGTPPAPGRDAEIKVETELAAQQGCKVGREGRLSFEGLRRPPVVEVGTLLARLIPSQPGVPGKDLQGKPVDAPPPRRRALQGGEGVEVSASGLEVRAAVKGVVVRPVPDRFEVLGILEVNHDLKLKDKRLDFPGRVLVRGTVTSGHKIRAKFLEVNELEPDCEVEVEGDLVIKGGAMGARMRTGGSLAARFVRDCQIVCQRDAILESEIVNSSLKCGGGVRLTITDSRIVNSTLAAIRGVSVGEIISSGAQASMIRLGVRPEFEKKIHGLRQRVENLLRERDVILEALEAQEEELQNTEAELRKMLAALKDPENSANRANLLSQVEMIKPMRQTLKDGVASGTARIFDLEIKVGRIQDEIDMMEEIIPKDPVWLDVRQGAEATTEVRGPHASYTLDRPKNAFSIGEVMVRDPNVQGGAQPEMNLIDLRSPQEQAAVTLMEDQGD